MKIIACTIAFVWWFVTRILIVPIGSFRNAYYNMDTDRLFAGRSWVMFGFSTTILLALIFGALDTAWSTFPIPFIMAIFYLFCIVTNAWLITTKRGMA